MTTPATDAALLISRLEFLCATKDAEIAQLRGMLVVEQLRVKLGASTDAQFDQRSFTFVEPAADADAAPAPASDDASKEVL